MRRIPALVSHLTFTIAVVAMYTSLNAQKPSESVRPSLISVSIAMKQSEIPLGQATWLIVDVKNTSNQSYNDSEILPHVEGEMGEPPKTLYHRQRRHEPDAPGLLVSGPPEAQEVKAGKTAIRQFDLTKYYDLSIPGKYSVCVEYLDEKGKRQRTNTVQFTVQAPAR